MSDLVETTGSEAGLTGDEQIRLAIRCIMDKGGEAHTKDFYEVINARMASKGYTLSNQGKASLRNFINKVAVGAGYIDPFDKANPGWRLTADGREFAETVVDSPVTVVNHTTGSETVVESNVARGTAFERYVLKLLKLAYPYYTWYHQGRDKKNERGLDFIGDRIGDAGLEPRKIGVQVKFHAEKYGPNKDEWLKFLSGCFARRVDAAWFITTGKLLPEQRREAGEAGVRLVEGRDEVKRLAEHYGLEAFSLFGDEVNVEQDDEPDA